MGRMDRTDVGKVGFNPGLYCARRLRRPVRSRFERDSPSNRCRKPRHRAPYRNEVRRGVLSRASARYWSRVPRDLSVLTLGTRKNFFSSSFLYTVCGLVRLNLSLASALHIQKASFYTQKYHWPLEGPGKATQALIGNTPECHAI
jgi:hypothetical protein